MDNYIVLFYFTFIIALQSTIGVGVLVLGTPFLLILNYDAYMASVISHILAAIVFFIVINLGVNFTKLFKNKNR